MIFVERKLGNRTKSVLTSQEHILDVRVCVLGWVWGGDECVCGGEFVGFV